MSSIEHKCDDLKKENEELKQKMICMHYEEEFR